MSFNPPYIFPPLSNKFLSFSQDRASAQQQLWMMEDTLAGLGAPQKPPPHTEPDSSCPTLQGEESSEREVRHTPLSPSPSFLSHLPLAQLIMHSRLSLSRDQLTNFRQVSYALEAFVSLFVISGHRLVLC